jgi:hypothetical protein
MLLIFGRLDLPINVFGSWQPRPWRSCCPAFSSSDMRSKHGSESAGCNSVRRVRKSAVVIRARPLPIWWGTSQFTSHRVRAFTVRTRACSEPLRIDRRRGDYGEAKCSTMHHGAVFMCMSFIRSLSERRWHYFSTLCGMFHASVFAACAACFSFRAAFRVCHDFDSVFGFAFSFLCDSRVFGVAVDAMFPQFRAIEARRSSGKPSRRLRKGRAIWSERITSSRCLAWSTAHIRARRFGARQRAVTRHSSGFGSTRTAANDRVPVQASFGFHQCIRAHRPKSSINANLTSTDRRQARSRPCCRPAKDDKGNHILLADWPDCAAHLTLVVARKRGAPQSARSTMRTAWS